MGLKLEVGKYYRDQNGRKIGPIVDHGWSDGFNFYGGKRMGFYNEEGRRQNNIDYIVSEWQDAPTGPVRTVTRKEIVPGVYGMVKVTTCPSSPLGVVGINLTSDGWWTAADIRAAIATLTEIAQALEDS